MDKELAAAAFHKLDSDSNGTISKDEFLCAVMSYYCEMTPTDTELADSQFLGRYSAYPSPFSPFSPSRLYPYRVAVLLAPSTIREYHRTLS